LVQALLTEIDHELSDAQRALWTHERVFPGGIAYLVTSVFRLRPGLSADRLQDYLAALVAAHEALRTSIAEERQGPLLRIAAPFRPMLRRVAVEDLDGPDCEAFLDLECTTAIDLAHAPLARFTYVADRGDHALLVVVMHHIIADFPSMDVLVGDLQRLAATGSLPLAIASRALVQQQRAFLQTESAAGTLAEWRRAMTPFMGQPRRHPRHRGGAASFCGFAMSDVLTVPVARLRRTARMLGATPFSLMLAAFALDEADLSRREEIIVGITMDAREGRDSRRIMGYHVNTLPVIVHLPQDTPFAAVVLEVHEQVNRLMHWRQIPFSRVMQGFPVNQEAMMQPVFEAMFHWLRFEPGFGGEADPVFLGLHPNRGQRQRGTTHDVVLTIEDRHAALHAHWVLSRDCFGSEETARRASRYGALVQQVVHDPQATLEETTAETKRRLDLYERLEF
jgi:hypothetical protein